MVNALKDTIQKAAEAFAEEIVAKTAESVRADIFAKLGVTSSPVKVAAVKHAGRPRGSKNKAKAANGIVVATTCLEPGCKEKRLAKGLCRKHYYKHRREQNAKSEQKAIVTETENAIAGSIGHPTAAAPF